MFGCSEPYGPPDVASLELTGELVFQSVEIRRGSGHIEVVSAANPHAGWGGVFMVGTVGLVLIGLIVMTLKETDRRPWLGVSAVVALLFLAVTWFAADKMWVDRTCAIDLGARQMTLRAERVWGVTELSVPLDGLEVSLWYMRGEQQRGLTHILRIGDHTVLVAYGRNGEDLPAFEALRDVFAASIGLPANPKRTHHYLGW